MSELEGIGEAVTGGMAARAVEPGAGEVASDGHTHESACLNCGTLLAGDFCHACGQRGHVHRTLRAFFNDLMHGVLHFEGKVWRTLPLLAWHPGRLTRRYIDGERAKFVSPIALFLFTVFLMFAIVSAVGNFNPDIASSAPRDLAAAEAEATGELEKLQTERGKLVAARQPTAKVDERIADAKAGLDVIRTLRSKGLTEGILKSETATFHSSIPWIEQAYLKAKENPQLLIFKLKTNSYKWSWALIPLSIPFLWLLFPFSRRFRTYDHVVFITYSLSFMSLLVVIGSMLAYAGAGRVAAFLLLLPAIHIYRQLAGAYGLGKWGALWRTFALMIGAVFVLSIFVLLIIAVGEVF